MRCSLRMGLMIAAAMAGLLTVGCSSQPRPPRVTLDPTYSYLNDQAYLADPAAWELDAPTTGTAAAGVALNEHLLGEPTRQ